MLFKEILKIINNLAPIVTEFYNLAFYKKRINVSNLLDSVIRSLSFHVMKVEDDNAGDFNRASSWKNDAPAIPSRTKGIEAKTPKFTPVGFGDMRNWSLVIT